MSFILNWFRKKEPEDYEQILASLALDIQKRQTRLSEIRLRERRATLLVTIYTLAFWTAYLTMWYTNVLPNLSGHKPNSAFEKFAKGAPVLVGPIVILFTRRIVQIWYTRIGDAEEKTLVTLHKQRSERIEEIKKKTNYYTTRNLLERYDDSPSTARASPNAPNSPMSQQQQQQRPMVKPPAQGTPPQQTPQRPTSKSSLAQMPQQPIPPPHKQWYDKLADAILGDDDSASSASSTSKYALICQKCFAHNGLVKESLWLDTQYICPKCGHFNGSARSQDQGSPPVAGRHKVGSAPTPTQRAPRASLKAAVASKVLDEGNSAAHMDVDS